MDYSFLDIDDVKQNLDLPVLGAISRITTQEEINKEKGKLKKFIVISLVVSFAAIITVMLMSLFGG